jgi:hypothetical protein
MFERDALVQAEVVVAAIRCWRSATDADRPAMPRLFALLADRDCEVMAPAFDSLLRLTEEVLDRPLSVGGRAGCSADEALLLELLSSRTRLQPRNARADALSALACAICSTRVMLRMALAPSPPSLVV